MTNLTPPGAPPLGKRRRKPIKRARMAPFNPGLTMGQLAVLGCIANQPDGVEVTPKLIAHDLGLAPTTVQARLEQMAKAGLIRKRGWEIV